MNNERVARGKTVQLDRYRHVPVPFGGYSVVYTLQNRTVPNGCRMTGFTNRKFRFEKVPERPKIGPLHDAPNRERLGVF